MKSKGGKGGKEQEHDPHQVIINMNYREFPDSSLTEPEKPTHSKGDKNENRIIYSNVFGQIFGRGISDGIRPGL
jgi:hypothetical protein